ncbi:abortive infection system antitoxin AbiGi family protein [Halonatronum saccharophilum]|uniref:abortive infection system antitoxin AbiGi family protein n=1 Tax=Halonatronum saccharophilum TaxID=150060 RepID=UPI000489ECA6|nr:abortive infection system antitoxin AbiGi family protein [Halonatronum saccharophilum]
MQRYYSKIYWHFTGSPDVNWSKVKMPKEIEGEYKKASESVEILKLILASKKLLAGSPEKIHGNVRTNGFCCVCDIPFKDLIYHANYYGKVAIGFSANSIYKYFNPVLYKECNFPIPSDIKVDSNRKLDPEKTFDSKASVYKLMSYLFNLEESEEYNVFLNKYLGELKKYIKITHFSEVDNETFYREREWRSTEGDYHFTEKDIEALLVPKKFISEVKNHLDINNYKDNITIIPFEFLEKA